MSIVNKKFYITTPIYYVNDRPHIGHAYTTVAADVLARAHKAKGEKIFFLTGTDEHGVKVQQAADKNGKSVQDFVDGNAQSFKDAWQKLNAQYDNFLRTTNQAHIKAVQNAVQELYDKGFIYRGEYEGLYCVSCEQYKFEDDLIDGKCREHNEKPVLMKEECYFFKLSQFEKTLKEKISSGEFLIEPPERKNEVLSFLNRGLKDISISRKKVKWGIPLPFDNSQTIYVWVDAFLNYLTGLGWTGSVNQFVSSSGGQTENSKINKPITDKLNFWPPDVQLMSKDILRVHATIWPALLLALELPLPKKIYVHGYFTIDGQKMSKSLGNVIWPEELVKKFGVDGARYLLMSSLAYGQDGDVTMERFTEKYNADLANGLGNLVSRIAKLSLISNFQFSISNKISKSKFQFPKLYEEIKLKEILDEIWEQISWANKRVEESKLWELVKNDENEAKKVLSELIGAISEIAEALVPFMPETSEKIKKILDTGAAEPLFPRV